MGGLETRLVGVLIYGGAAPIALWVAAAMVLFLGSKFFGRTFEITCSYVFAAMGVLVGLSWIWSALFGTKGTSMGSESPAGTLIGAFFILVGIASWKHGQLIRQRQ